LTNNFLKSVVRVASVAPEIDVANIDFNVQSIVKGAKDAFASGAKVIVFPELSITGYTCGDLFFQASFIERALVGLAEIADQTKNIEAIMAVGLPIIQNGKMYNCGAVMQSGKIIGVIPKQTIPNKREFYEARWFSSGRKIRNQVLHIADQLVPFGVDMVFHEKNSGMVLGLEICEDLWSPVPPSSHLALFGANVILNLSASNALVGKSMRREELIRVHSEKLLCAYIYASSGPFESTSELVFSSHCVIAECGKLLSEDRRIIFDSKIVFADIDLEFIVHERLLSPGFSEEFELYGVRVISIDSITNHQDVALGSLRHNPSRPFIPGNDAEKGIVCSEIISIQSAALCKKMLAGKFNKVVIGISGGLDSTLALLVAELSFRKLGLAKDGIIGVTMPGFGTSRRTYQNAVALIDALGISLREVPIIDSSNINFRDIGHDPDCHDVTYQNVQARVRTQILMNLANKESSFVLGTGDLSESALGWCTFNGDHMSMYQINCGIPKTLVKHLVEWLSEDSYLFNSRAIIQDILSTPISPELLPLGADGNEIQATEELVGPYELNDYFLYNFIRNGYRPEKIFYFSRMAFAGKYNEKILLHWLDAFFKRFFSQQYKRSAVPDGPKIGSVGLSPKTDWRMPSDLSAVAWLKEIEKMKRNYD